MKDIFFYEHELIIFIIIFCIWIVNALKAIGTKRPEKMMSNLILLFFWETGSICRWLYAEQEKKTVKYKIF